MQFHEYGDKDKNTIMAVRETYMSDARKAAPEK